MRICTTFLNCLFKVRGLWSVLLMVLFINTIHAEDCAVNMSANEGCAPYSVNFTVDYDPSLNINTILWSFGDGNQSSQESPTHIFNTPGIYSPEVTIEFDDGSTCEVSADQELRIYDSPDVEFQFPDNSIQCLDDNEFCFTDLSSPGDDDAPLERWIWEFDDGDTARTSSPCKSFSSIGSYNISLEVRDTNGCFGFYEKDGIEVIPSIEASFIYDFDELCPDPIVRFTNNTDTSGHRIENFYWDFGDGNADSSGNNWTDFTYQYTEEGDFYPTLIVETETGCISEYTISASILNSYRQINPVVVSDKHQCIEDHELELFHAEISDGDPNWIIGMPDGFDVRMASWEANLSGFPEPGTYHLAFEVNKRNCYYDTTLCDVITIQGPKAHIDDPVNTFPNDTLPPRPFPEDDFPETIMCHGEEKEQPTDYVTLDTTIIENGKPVYDFCNADTLDYSKDSIVTIENCPAWERYNIEWQPSDTVWVNDTIYEEVDETYQPGDPMPENPLLQATGRYNPGAIHDTNLIKPECGGPNYVQFENHSMKFRGQQALDDSAYVFPDTCKLPGDPGASDSLSYFWDFDNDEADDCISTPDNPNVNCNYSTERNPLHVYQEEGCFNPELRVTDSVTGCVSYAETEILMKPPDAGWEGGFDNMTWEKQNQNSEKRTGLRLQGERCYGPFHPHAVDINELIPSPEDCKIDEVWITFDSAATAQKEYLCTATLEDQDGNDSVAVDSKTTWEWIYFGELENGQWEYESGGCKTIGVVVKSGECLDTAWYSNYRCLPESGPEFSILNEPSQTGNCDEYSVYGHDQNKLFCQNETLQFELDHPDQDSLKRYVYTYENLETGETLPNDTLPYSDFSPDTTADGHYVQEKKFDNPGKYLITGIAEHFTGCRVPFYKIVNIGVSADFTAESDTALCAGETFELSQDVRYFHTFCDFEEYEEYVLDDSYWEQSNRPERLYWDMNNDGDIDATGPDPEYIYDSTGIFDVTLHAVDSSGCTTSVVKENFVHITDIKADFILDEESDRENHCAPVFIGFENNSELKDGLGPDQKDEHFASSFEWEFGDGKPNSVLENPVHVYNNNEVYDVTFMVESSFGCTDTITKDSAVIIHGPMPRFEIISDTAGCVPHTVTVENQSDNVDDLLWELGDGSVVSSGPDDSTVDLTYQTPGIYEIFLTGNDSVTLPDGSRQYCEDTWPDDENSEHPSFLVEVYPNDELDFDFEDDICVGEEMRVTNNSDTTYSEFFWEIDGDSVMEDEPVVAFDEPGTYDFYVRGEGARCPHQDSFSVNVHDVTADFEATEEAEVGLFSFEPTSPDEGTFNWTFGENEHEKTRDQPETVEYRFSDQGYFNVCMEVTSPHECRDDICKEIEVIADIYIPNVFSPTDDGYNDYFFIDIKGEVAFELVIFNRWGEKVFESEDSDEKWNGTVFNDGEICEPGTYYFVLKYRHVGGEDQQVSGTVTLLR